MPRRKRVRSPSPAADGSERSAAQRLTAENAALRAEIATLRENETRIESLFGRGFTNGGADVREIDYARLAGSFGQDGGPSSQQFVFATAQAAFTDLPEFLSGFHIVDRGEMLADRGIPPHDVVPMLVSRHIVAPFIPPDWFAFPSRAVGARRFFPGDASIEMKCRALRSACSAIGASRENDFEAPVWEMDGVFKFNKEYIAPLINRFRAEEDHRLALSAVLFAEVLVRMRRAWALDPPEISDVITTAARLALVGDAMETSSNPRNAHTGFYVALALRALNAAVTVLRDSGLFTKTFLTAEVVDQMLIPMIQMERITCVDALPLVQIAVAGLFLRWSGQDQLWQSLFATAQFRDGFLIPVADKVVPHIRHARSSSRPVGPEWLQAAVSKRDTDTLNHICMLLRATAKANKSVFGSVLVRDRIMLPLAQFASDDRMAGGLCETMDFVATADFATDAVRDDFFLRLAPLVATDEAAVRYCMALTAVVISAPAPDVAAFVTPELRSASEPLFHQYVASGDCVSSNADILAIALGIREPPRPKSNKEKKNKSKKKSKK